MTRRQACRRQSPVVFETWSRVRLSAAVYQALADEWRGRQKPPLPLIQIKAETRRQPNYIGEASDGTKMSRATGFLIKLQSTRPSTEFDVTKLLDGLNECFERIIFPPLFQQR